MSNRPNGTPFLVVQKGDSLWKLSQQTFNLTSNGAIANKVAELTRLNPHIKDPNRIYPGQVLVLQGGGVGSLNIFGNDLEGMENAFRSCSDSELECLIQNWDALEILSHELDNTGSSFVESTGMTPSTLSQDLQGIAKPLPGHDTFKKVLGTTFGTVKRGAKTFKLAAHGEFGNFLKSSPHVWDKVHGELTRSLAREARYVKRADGALRMIPKNSRVFSQAGSVIVVSPKNESFSAFATQVNKAKNLSTKLAKGAGVVSIVIDLGVAGTNIYDNWGTADQNKTIFKETGKFGAGLAGGSVGMALAPVVCGVLTVTTGVGGAICYFSVFVGTSMAMKYGGEVAGEAVYESAGKFLGL